MNFYWLVILGLYLILNIYVLEKISHAYYLSESRRKIHKWFIWIVPFFGPLIIHSFWTGKKKKLETKTKHNRKKNTGNFYESGIGIE